jgi:adenylate kinase
MSGKDTRVILLGAPGAGKGTQSKLLAQNLGVPHIATGDMFRAAKAAGTSMGLRAKEYMDQGELVPDDVTIGVIEERLQAPDAQDGYILDGFPRTAVQAEALNKLLARLGQRLDAVLKLTVPQPELLRRLTGRRVCPNCGANYHLDSAPPKVAGVCDHCGATLQQRDDDSEATVAHRLDVYDKNTRPLIAYYEKMGLLHRIDGTQAIDAVHQALVEAARGMRVKAT